MGSVPSSHHPVEGVVCTHPHRLVGVLLLPPPGSGGAGYCTHRPPVGGKYQPPLPPQKETAVIKSSPFLSLPHQVSSSSSSSVSSDSLTVILDTPPSVAQTTKISLAQTSVSHEPITTTPAVIDPHSRLGVAVMILCLAAFQLLDLCILRVNH